MCSPIAIAQGGLGVAQSTFSFLGANSQAQYANQQYKQTAANALTNFTQQTASANTRMEQNALAAGQQATASQSQAAQAEGHAAASAAGAGVAGNSLAELHNDLARLDALNEHAINTNLGMQTTQLQQDEKSMQAAAQSRTNAAIPGPQQNSLASALIGGASSVFGAIDSFNRWNSRGPYNPNGSMNSAASSLYRPLFSIPSPSGSTYSNTGLPYDVQD